MQTLKKTLALSATVAVLATAAPAFAADYTIGFLGGFTGSLESLTPPIYDGAKLAVQNVNDQGGVAGGTLKIVSGDSACAATQGATAADKEINTDHVLGIIGPMCSPAFIAAANNAGIPGNVVMISPSATAPSISTLEDNDLVFRVAPSDSYQGEVLAKVIKDQGVNDIVITYVNNDYGKGLADTLAAAFKKLGGTVAANVAHEDGKADYRAELGNLASTGVPNLVILAYANGSGQTILRQATESGDFTTYFGADGMVSDTLFNGIDTAAVNGMIATKAGTPDVPGAKVFTDLATKAGIDATAVYAPQAYDGAFLLALALEKNNGAQDGLSKALREVASGPGETILPGEWKKAVDLIKAGKDINYEGASGSDDFDANGDVSGTIVEMKVEDGKFVEVGPAMP